jgi:hypothetical protein
VEKAVADAKNGEVSSSSSSNTSSRSDSRHQGCKHSTRATELLFIDVQLLPHRQWKSTTANG